MNIGYSIYVVELLQEVVKLCTETVTIGSPITSLLSRYFKFILVACILASSRLGCLSFME